MKHPLIFMALLAATQLSASAQTTGGGTGGGTTPPPTGGHKVQTIEFAGTLNLTDPCNGHAFSMSGTTRLSIRSLAGSVLVTERFEGESNGYEAQLIGWKTFSQPSTSYQVPVRGYFESDHSQFLVKGIDRVDAASGAPTGDFLQITSSRCDRD